MAATIAENTVQIRVYQSLYGQRVENGFYIQAPNDPDTVLLEGLATTVLTEWEQHILPTQSQDLTLRGVNLISLDTATGPSYEEFLVSPLPGGTVSASLPGSVAFVIKFSTAQRGRSRRGRVYMSGIPEQDVTGNFLNSSPQADMVSGWRTFLTNVADSIGGVHVVISRTSDPATVTRVTSVDATDNVLDSQRRRLTGRGV
jgi:hypothetical protein